MALLEAKKKKVEELKELLLEHKSFMLSSYSHLDVPSQNELRSELRSNRAVLKMLKNSLFQLALKEANMLQAQAKWQKISSDLQGPLMAAFVKEGDFSVAAKILLAYSKKAEAMQVKSACLDDAYLALPEVKEMSVLPSRAELLAMIAQALQGPSVKIARGVSEVMTSLARAIKAVGEGKERSNA